jgi:type I restriction-modification system DNA methylase subunit
MPIYTCQKCDKEFPNKGDYTRHINRKIDCSGKTLEEKISEKIAEKVAEVVDEKVAEVVEELIEEKTGKSKNKDTTSLIMNLVDNLHNVLRKDAIIGSDAYHDINKLLFLRFIQPCVTTTLTTLVDPEMYENVEDFDESIFEYLKDLNKLVVISDLDEFEKEVKILYKRILGTHPLTREIFNKNDYFKAKAKTLRTCLQKIVKTINDEDFDNLDSDIKGLIYEHFLNGYADKGGKEFGQFFTPRNLINLIMKLNNEVFDDIKEKTLKTVYDPCMGTAGFLTEAYKYLKNNKTQEIKTDENKSIDIKLHGTELEPKTYASGIMNVLLTTGGIHSVQCKNSLYDNKSIEFDWIVTNPPFGVKGIKYNEILQSAEHEAKQNSMIRGQKNKKQKKTSFEMSELYPIKTNDCSALFLQHCIKKLKNNGICNIVLPDGQLTNSKTSIKLREYLVNECDLKAVLTIPNGTFKHAGVATIVLFFSKQEETRTNEVKFYEAINNCQEYKLLCTVDNETLEQNKYVLNYKNYMPKEELKVRGNAELKTLGEVCKINIGFTPSTKDASLYDNNGYVWISIADMTNFYIGNSNKKISKQAVLNKTDKLVKKGNVLFSFKLSIGKVCMATQDLYTNEAIASICSNDESILLNKYIAYYLSSQDFSQSGNGCIGNGSMNKTSVSNIQIPVPSLDVQEEIIADCEVMEESKRLSLMQIENIKKIIDIYNRTQIKTLFDLPNIEKKTIEDLCDFSSGKFNSRDKKEEGKYAFYTSTAINPSGRSDNYCFDFPKYIILNKDGGSGDGVYGDHIGLGKSYLLEGKSAATSHQLCLVNKDETLLLLEYLHVWLCVNKNQIMDLAHYTTGLGCIRQSDIKEISIPVPSIEKQKEIIKKYESKQLVLENYNNEIENIKKYITDIENLRKDLF